VTVAATTNDELVKRYEELRDTSDRGELGKLIGVCQFPEVSDAPEISVNLSEIV
jgi:hypothetical protein